MQLVAGHPISSAYACERSLHGGGGTEGKQGTIRVGDRMSRTGAACATQFMKLRRSEVSETLAAVTGSSSPQCQCRLELAAQNLQLVVWAYILNLGAERLSELLRLWIAPLSNLQDPLGACSTQAPHSAA